jgi:hypothetical protein
MPKVREAAEGIVVEEVAAVHGPAAVAAPALAEA